MNKLTSLEEVLSGSKADDDLYISDKKKRYYRGTKGVYAKANFDFINLIKCWEDIVGPLMAQNTIPLKIMNKKLIIVTKHAVFAQELGLISPQILEKICSRFPVLMHKINKIKFSHSDYNSYLFNNKNKEPKEPKSTYKGSLHPFSPEYKQKKSQAKKLFKDIDDEEIKDSLTKYLLTL